MSGRRAALQGLNATVGNSIRTNVPFNRGEEEQTWVCPGGQQEIGGTALTMGRWVLAQWRVLIYFGIGWGMVTTRA